MKVFTGIAAARDAAQEWFFANRATLEPHVTERLAPLFRTGGSPVDAVVNTAEIIFANKGKMKPDALQLAAGLSAFREGEGYHYDEAEPKRANKMALALRRDAGERAPAGTKWPTKDQDPKPDVRFAPAPPAPPPTPAPPPNPPAV